MYLLTTALTFKHQFLRYLFSGIAVISTVIALPASANELANTQQIEQYLQSFDGEQAIIERAKVIKSLAARLQTDPLTLWLNEQLVNDDKITQANPDHLNQVMTLVSVANSAKATLLHWRVAALTNEYLSQFTENRWLWTEFVESSDDVKSMALARLITELSSEQLVQLQQSASLSQARAQITNRDLYTLVKALPNSMLSEQLIENKTDEFSYQHLALLPSLYSEQQAMQLLILSAENEKLASQSIMMMSKQYGDMPQAQEYLISALTQNKDISFAWHVAAAVSQTHSDSLRRKVQAIDSKSPSKKTSAVKFAQTKLVQSQTMESQAIQQEQR